MKAPKHTPGPWKLLEPDQVVGPEGEFIADCSTGHTRRQDTDRHNAILIALTPEMAAELARLRAQVAELRGALVKMVAAYDEILTSGLPAVVKASFAARCDGETARAALVRTAGGQEVGK